MNELKRSQLRHLIREFIEEIPEEYIRNTQIKHRDLNTLINLIEECGYEVRTDISGDFIYALHAQ
jgi:hypothetical protein